jgi:hypothetical protein
LLPHAFGARLNDPGRERRSVKRDKWSKPYVTIEGDQPVLLSAGVDANALMVKDADFVWLYAFGVWRVNVGGIEAGGSWVACCG